jgi:uncharacterized protein
VNQMTEARRLCVALLALVVWMLATVGGGAIYRDAPVASLAEAVESHSTGISWNVCAAIAVLALVSILWRWADLKFVRPNPAGSIRLLWLPALSLVPFAALAKLLGLPPSQAMLVLAVNCALIGLSEEWMFRGILFQALRTRLSLWPAITVSSMMFGAVHLLNAFTTGYVLLAALQALAASMSGLLFVAILIRTGSIWPAIIYHALWDFGILVTTVDAVRSPLPDGPLPLVTYVIPFVLVAPNFVYALYLLRKVRNDTRLTTDLPDGVRSAAT